MIMKIIQYKIGCISLIFLLSNIFLSCKSQNGNYLIERNILHQNRNAIVQGDLELNQALELLIVQADSVLKVPIRTVIQKKQMPPSNDKKDYLSLGQYWWPDPRKPDGLPYIRRDGKTNPEFSKVTDNSYMRQMSTNVRLLAVAYYYTNNERYARKAAEQLRAWFLDSKTGMNPNLNHAQYIPGVNDGRSEGIIDTRVLVSTIDGAKLLVGSSSWTSQDEQELKNWFSKYLNWLQTSDLGKGCSRYKNNIGTAYYMQLIGYAVFSDNKELAKRIIKNKVYQLLEYQIDNEGKQPEELKRANSWNYTIANLNYWFRIAQLAETVNIDLWNYRTASGKSIRSAYEWCLPYATNNAKWGYEQNKKIDFSNSFSSLRARGDRKFSSSSIRTSNLRNKQSSARETNAEASTTERIRGGSINAFEILTGGN